MQNKFTVLVAENEEKASASIVSMLQSSGYRPLTANTGSTAISMISSHCPDLVLLNSSLPDINGLDVLACVRQWSEIPVIVLSSHSDEGEEVKALDMGADDYMAQPFGSSELLARIRTALRHSIKLENAGEAGTGVLNRGTLSIDPAKHTVTVDGKNIHLTQNEYKILLLLAKHPGQVLSYATIIEQVWGHFAADDRQILRVNIANIRRKIESTPAEPSFILTEVGVGYRMAENPEDKT